MEFSRSSGEICRSPKSFSLKGKPMDTPAKTITINGKAYALDDLTKDAKSQVINLRVVDQEIARLEALLAITKTARAAYAKALGGELSKTEKVN
jgi:hypothetical protein